MTYLYDPRSQERDNQNSLRKYPFADSASCGNGSCIIPPGAVIDAQLYVPGREAGRVWLSLVDSDGRLHFSDAGGEIAVTSQPVRPMSAVPVTFTGDGGPLPGGVIVCGGVADVSALTRAGRQVFSAAEGELAASAVTFTGARGVLGFRLDDGHTVWGDVRIRGANGCDVATYVDADGVRRFRISAIGQAAAEAVQTGFVKKVVADSNNMNFTVAQPERTPNRVIQVYANGAYAIGDDDIPADQENACAAVRKARGTVPSSAASVTTACEDAVCGRQVSAHTLVLMDGKAEKGTVTLIDGAHLGTVPRPEKSGSRFTGYFGYANDGGVIVCRKYYRTDGVGVGTFNAGACVPFDTVDPYLEVNEDWTVNTGIGLENGMTVVMDAECTGGGNRTWWCSRHAVEEAVGSTISLVWNEAVLRADVFGSQTNLPTTWSGRHVLAFSAEHGLYADGAVVVPPVPAYTLPGYNVALMASYANTDTMQGPADYFRGKIYAFSITSADGAPLINLIPVTRDGARLLYDTVSGDLFYPDGTRRKKADLEERIVLHAHWITAESSAEASFGGYGSLHLLAPDLANYSNPLLISGGAGVIPNVMPVTQGELAEGGSDTLADIVLHPSVPSGEVRISIRGLNKAFDS